ncbi:MAG: Lin0512 family protein [Pseudomonadota bacterium]
MSASADLSLRRIILEMGTGNDLYGENYTKAACRAVQDAIHHSSLLLFRSLDIDPATMEIAVTVAAQQPDAVDREAVARELPYGRVSVEVTPGGLDIDHPDTGRRSVIVNVALDVRVPIPAR